MKADSDHEARKAGDAALEYTPAVHLLAPRLSNFGQQSSG